MSQSIKAATSCCAKNSPRCIFTPDLTASRDYRLQSFMTRLCRMEGLRRCLPVNRNRGKSTTCPIRSHYGSRQRRKHHAKRYAWYGVGPETKRPAQVGRPLAGRNYRTRPRLISLLVCLQAHLSSRIRYEREIIAQHKKRSLYLSRVPLLRSSLLDCRFNHPIGSYVPSGMFMVVSDMPGGNKILE